MGAFLQNLRAGDEIGAEGVSTKIDSEIPYGGAEKAIDEVRERGEGEVSEYMTEAKRQRSEGDAEMQPAEGSFQLLMMVTDLQRDAMLAAGVDSLCCARPA